MALEYRIAKLWHLTGLTVKVVIDGALHPDRVVDNNGEILLDPDIFEYSLANGSGKATVGLSYLQDIETLPPAWEGVEAAGQSSMKNVSNAHVRVHKSTAILAGPGFDRLRLFPPRTNEPYGKPPNLKSQYIEIPLDPEWSIDATVCIRNEDPLPCTVTGLVLDIEV